MSRKRHINRWIGGAYLVRDPELRSTGGGTSVCEMRIGVHGAGQDYGDGYFDLVVFEDQAEHCARYLKAGSEIDVEARLHFREFERDDNTKGVRISLIADRVNFAGGGNSKSSSEDDGATEDAAREEHADVPVSAGGGSDDDVQF